MNIAESRLTEVRKQLLETAQARDSFVAREQTSKIDRVSNLQMIRSLRSQVAELENARAGAVSNELKSALEAQKNLETTHACALKSLQQELQDKSSMIRSLEATIRQRQESYTHEVTKLTSSLESIDRECDATVRRIHNEKMELESRYESRIFELDSMVTDLRAQVEQQVAVNSKLSRKLQFEQLGYEDKIATLQAEAKKMRVRLDEINTEKASQEEQIKALHHTIDEINRNAKSHTAEITEFRSMIDQLRALVKERESRISELSLALTESDKVVNSLKLRCSTLQDEVYSLEEQQGSESSELKAAMGVLQLKCDDLMQRLSESQQLGAAAKKTNENLEMEIVSSKELVSAMRSAQQENASKVTYLEATVSRLEEQARQEHAKTKSISEQRAAAEVQFQNRIREMQISLESSKCRIAELTELLSQRDQHCIQLNETTKKLTEEIQSVRLKYDAMERQYTEVTENSEKSASQRNKLEMTITQYTEELRMQSQKISVLSRDHAAALARAENLETLLADAQSKGEDLKSALQIQVASLEKANTEIMRLKEESTNMGGALQKDNYRLTLLNAELQQQFNSLEIKLQSSEAETTSLQEQTQELLELVQQQQQALDDASRRESEWAQIRSNLMSTASERTEKYKQRIAEIEVSHRQAIQQLRKVNDELMIAHDTIREKNACLTEYKARLDELAEEARRTTSTVSTCYNDDETANHDIMSSVSKITECSIVCSKCRASCSERGSWFSYEEVRDSIESSLSLVSLRR